jgi:regulator of PEP synthase PpsR (kinase-PPPase family)
MGTSGQALVDRALAQFPDAVVPVVTIPGVRSRSDLHEVVLKAAGDGGTIVHTLVDADLRQEMIHLAQQHNVVAIDLIGRVLERLSQTLRQAPVQRPGLYRQLHEEYFRRIEAIEYTVAHDDGQRIDDLHEAEIVLTGVSRVSKTPLSIFLSVQGWKVANVPIVLHLDPPRELFEVPRGRVVGLTVDSNRLKELRERRGRTHGLLVGFGYADDQRVLDEIQWARLVFRRGGFATVDVTSRSIEESAQAVVDLVRRRT